MMVVGLQSGKELLVQDKSYFISFKNGNKLTEVFVSTNGKRRFEVDHSMVEYYDREQSEEYMAELDKSIELTRKQAETTNKGVDYA